MFLVSEIYLVFQKSSNHLGTPLETSSPLPQDLLTTTTAVGAPACAPAPPPLQDAAQAPPLPSPLPLQLVENPRTTRDAQNFSSGGNWSTTRRTRYLASCRPTLAQCTPPFPHPFPPPKKVEVEVRRAERSAAGEKAEKKEGSQRTGRRLKDGLPEKTAALIKNKGRESRGSLRLDPAWSFTDSPAKHAS